MATATEIYASYLLDENEQPQYIRVFDVDLPPQVALGSSGPASLPKFGDSFPDDPTLFVDSRRILERRSTSLTRVAIRYSRVTFEGVNIYSTDTDPGGAYVRTEYQSLSETIGVPRYVQITKDIGGTPTVVEYPQRTQNQPIRSTLITKILHRRTWSKSDEESASAQIGKIHTDLGTPAVPPSIFDSQARFLGFEATQSGEQLWRIVYRWKLAYPFGPFLAQPIITTGLDFAAVMIPVFNLNATTGEFPPHSVIMPVVSSTSTIANIGADSQPRYAADLIFTSSSLSNTLPGLT